MKPIWRTHFWISLLLFTGISVSPALSDPRTIGTAELHSLVMNNAYLLEAGRQQEPIFVIIIDARQREEYAAAHVLSAINVPEQEFDTSIGLLPQDKAALLVVYGNNAKQVVEKASKAGYTNIEMYAEEFRVWKEQSMPIAPL